MILLCLLALGLLGWFHGREMYELGKQTGRHELRREQLEQELRDRRQHLRLVK